MYDPATASLIRSTPELDGLDRSRLPEELSKAFAEISSARLKLRQTNEFVDAELSALIKRMQRLAFTNEALVASSPERTDRASAAFVAGSAHLLGFNARQVLGEQRKSAYLGAHSISTDVAAMLLFLIAEATADAAEIAKRVHASEDGPVIQLLIQSLTALARGDLAKITELAIPELNPIEDDAELALSALYRQLFIGVKDLSDELLGDDEVDVGSAIEVFRMVKELCASTPSTDHGLIGAEIGAFPGPHHLACLLIAVASDLPSVAVTMIAAPPGIDPDSWRTSIRKIANGRPYLWRNHREAIQKGYLSPGISSAVGFPTGAGKSTLAELKINATLLTGKKVVFLAPTNALVAQTTASLRSTFPEESVEREALDDLVSFEDESQGSAILVMTPEACLARISVNRDAFGSVGLLVFDECHLLHAVDETRGRRALDAMLCVLSFTEFAPAADLLLLSAMMKNTAEIASWIQSITGRGCLSLTLSWKPTRQLRGSVVYPQKQVRQLSAGLTIAKKQKKTKAPSTKDKQALICQAQGLFCLQQTWATREIEDYALVDLSSSAVQLGANDYWKLTPNSGEVSARIAAEGVRSGLNTLIFFQTIKNAVSAVKKVSALIGETEIPLLEHERHLLKTAVDELGGDKYLFISIENNALTSKCVVHHGLLLPEERHLCESLYGRKNGASVMAATSTVAQGMNFPSELVIIAEDSRFDEAKDKREVLEAQELLNAAGRAGRAGLSANGIVLVIPGRVVEIDLEDATIGEHWTSLQKIFGQSDQCLEIDDPLTAVLDRVHANLISPTEIDRYVIARLSSIGESEDAHQQLVTLVSRSFGAYRAKVRGQQSWVDERIQSAVAFQANEMLLSDFSALEQQIASTLGFPLSIVVDLAGEFPDLNVAEKDVLGWLDWMFDWIESHPEHLDQIIRPESMSELFGKTFTKLSDASDRVAHALPTISTLTRLWMQGEPISTLEIAIGTKVAKLGACEKARKFVLRIIPELAYFFNIPALLLQRRAVLAGIEFELPAGMEQFSRCTRDGYSSYECAAFAHQRYFKGYSRREMHRQFNVLKEYLPEALSPETWGEALARVRVGLANQKADEL